MRLGAVMLKAICGSVAGLAIGGAAFWGTGDQELSVAVGAAVAITVWFWSGLGAA